MQGLDGTDGKRRLSTDVRVCDEICRTGSDGRNVHFEECGPTVNGKSSVEEELHSEHSKRRKDILVIYFLGLSKISTGESRRGDLAGALCNPCVV